jgi:glutamate-ammonia-ligase adenylyltransferase
VGQGVAPAGLIAAEQFLTRLLITLRLVAPDAEIPPPATRALIARALGMADWDAVVATFAATRQEVTACLASMATGDDDGD